MEFIIVKVKNFIYWEYVYKVYYIKTRDFHFVSKILSQKIVGSFCQKNNKTEQYEFRSTGTRPQSLLVTHSMSI